ncbi:MAG: NAD(+)/NADH kinase [Clostridia bacterium]|nr:NAD(+)/NADH kinase [Clostridia bacterium]
MKFFFKIHPSRPQAETLKKQAEAFIRKHGHESTPDPLQADFAVSIGGDGTVVSAHKLCKKPLIGVNAGTLGYLPKIEPENLECAFEKIFSGEFFLENRMTLSTVVDGIPMINALNDVALQKADHGVIRFTVNVDGVNLMRYTADGLIAATPTGSTGYSLSAGGPIVDPVSESIVLTPLAPHTLVSRSIILSANSFVTLECENDAVLSVDGDIHPIRAHAKIRISKAPEPVRFVTLSRESFVERLRKKLS